jgi:tRNA(fMet)-specific endonuclease VapC
MAGYLIDTGLVLRHLRGHRTAVRLRAGLGKLGRLSIASVTRLEVHAGMHEDQRTVTYKLLSRFVAYDLDREIAGRAGDLIRQCRDRRIALSVPDAIIAATALANGLTLVTLNRADFEGIPGLSLAPLPEEISS